MTLFSQYRLPLYTSGLALTVDSYFQGERYLKNRPFLITEKDALALVLRTLNVAMESWCFLVLMSRSYSRRMVANRLSWLENVTCMELWKGKLSNSGKQERFRPGFPVSIEFLSIRIRFGVGVEIIKRASQKYMACRIE